MRRLKIAYLGWWIRVEKAFFLLCLFSWGIGFLNGFVCWVLFIKMHSHIHISLDNNINTTPTLNSTIMGLSRNDKKEVVENKG
jgi:hypothetical protein